MVAKEDFRKCMSKFATGVTVVTTLDDEGNVHGYERQLLHVSVPGAAPRAGVRGS